jgi:type IV pilus assembly protein PilA
MCCAGIPLMRRNQMAGIDDRRVPGRGFTLIELLIVIVVIAILASIAVPSLLQSRMAANETSATNSLRIIAKGMETYRIREMGGSNSYPADYRALGTMLPPELDAILASGEKSGYAFSGGGAASNFAINAVPVRYGVSGRRSFYVDASGVIRFSEDNGNPAGPGNPPIQ